MKIMYTTIALATGSLLGVENILKYLLLVLLFLPFAAIYFDAKLKRSHHAFHLSTSVTLYPHFLWWYAAEPERRKSIHHRILSLAIHSHHSKEN